MRIVKTLMRLGAQTSRTVGFVMSRHSYSDALAYSASSSWQQFDACLSDYDNNHAN